VYEAKYDRPRLLKALREATKGFVAITDTPGTQFIGELCEIYPDAKVICWRRDPQRWWKSMEQMIKHSMPQWLHWYLAPMPGWRWFPSIMSEMSKKCVGSFHVEENNG
jgi:Sulfotransferase domain